MHWVLSCDRISSKWTWNVGGENPSTNASSCEQHAESLEWLSYLDASAKLCNHLATGCMSNQAHDFTYVFLILHLHKVICMPTRGVFHGKEMIRKLLALMQAHPHLQTAKVALKNGHDPHKLGDMMQGCTRPYLTAEWHFDGPWPPTIVSCISIQCSYGSWFWHAIVSGGKCMPADLFSFASHEPFSVISWSEWSCRGQLNREPMEGCWLGRPGWSAIQAASPPHPHPASWRATDPAEVILCFA